MRQAVGRAMGGAIVIAALAVAGAADEVLDAQHQTEDQRSAASGAPDVSGTPIGLDPDAKIAGWSRFPITQAERVIYVSRSEGDDQNSGLSPDAPLRTLARGKRMLRDGHGDWLLLKRGDTFPNGLGEWRISGASKERPMIVGAYGRGARPRLQPQGKPMLTASAGNPRHLAFISLHAHAARRDPASPDFNGGTDKTNGVFWTTAGGDIRFEDCLFEYFNNNLAFISPGWQNPIEDITLYRCIVRNSYATPEQGFAKQGVFARNVHGMRIKQSVFYHNGWSERVEGAGRTMFGHNVYLAGSKDLRIDNSLIAYGALNGLNLRTGNQPDQVQRRVVARGNLLIGNANGIEAGAVKGREMRSRHLRIEKNVLLRHGGRIPMGDERPTIANGIILSNWDGAIVRDNLLLRSPQGAGGAAIKVQVWKRIESRQVRIEKNTVHAWGEDRLVPKGSGVRLIDNRRGGPAERFAAPGRSLPRYLKKHTSLDSIDAYLQRACAMRKGDWPKALGPAAINAYLRAGFTPRQETADQPDQPGDATATSP
jgi:hypothetical protein